MAYKPKATAGAQPIDIADDVSRRKAMMAMFDDEVAASGRELQQAKSAENLTPIMRARAEDPGPVCAGNNRHRRGRTDGAGHGRDRTAARTLIDTEVGLVHGRIGGVEKKADQTTNSAIIRASPQVWWNTGPVAKGLTSSERKDLRDTIDYLDKVHQTAQRGHQIAEQVGGNIAAWDGTLERIAQTTVYAQNVLEAD